MTAAARVDQASVIAALLAALARDDMRAVLETVEQANLNAPDVFPAVLRTAGFHVVREPLHYRKLHNAWTRAGRPALKPAARTLKIEVISDFTAQGLAPYLEFFCALYGLHAEVRFAAYDSVEHAAYTPLAESHADVSFLLLSDHWARRWIGAGPVEAERLAEAEAVLRRLLTALSKNRVGPVVVATLGPGAWPAPGGALNASRFVGHAAALARLNDVIVGTASNRLLPLDLNQALHRAGGIDAVATAGYLRSRAAFSERGLLVIARELAAGLAQLFGRAHRAVLTDWDNTLWGGEVGELGSLGVVCGQETADALGYFLVQAYLRDLMSTGIILAAVSRNAPDVARILDENPNLALQRADFACLAIGWGRKSQSVHDVQQQLKFGTDLMLFIDDSPVELVDVLVRHPDIDVVLAGPTPEHTLDRLASGSFFGLLTVTDEDRERPARAAAIAQQHQDLAGSSDLGAFLASLGMRLTVAGVSDANAARVLQLLQKTNQFNLTNRRHTEPDLQRLKQQGARIGVFSYSDRFGPQGVIGLIILADTGDTCEIDTWLMSCRVLNRGVEAAMLTWVIREAGDREIVGRYVASEKNGLVAEHYPRLGFRRIDSDSGQVYGLSAAEHTGRPIQHYLECSDDA